MYIILVYDVNRKRVSKVNKICKKYIPSVQKSVFEGDITQSKLNSLKEELEKIIKPSEDAVCIYEFESTKYAKKEEIGGRVVISNII